MTINVTGNNDTVIILNQTNIAFGSVGSQSNTAFIGTGALGGVAAPNLNPAAYGVAAQPPSIVPQPQVWNPFGSGVVLMH
ncbi:MAG TPA: hypothetical protein VKV26_13270 [Dehalococcoidia bacterium]|nr:hypothetical protein [Dehalococcoidia bacterium]